jgi:hypothetical protein
VVLVDRAVVVAVEMQVQHLLVAQALQVKVLVVEMEQT